MPETTLATDHPGWEPLAGGQTARLVRTKSGVWLAEWTGTALNLRCFQGTDADRPTITTVQAADLPPRTPLPLVTELTRLGVVHRLGNPWLWDAITTAILRQVVRAAQARALYRRWCQAHGMSLAGERGTLALPPGPETVLALPDAAFAETGTAFHRTALQAAARAYLEHAATWIGLLPGDLVKALDAVPRIGPWTAQAATADFIGDFSVYPHGDLAVRTWAGRIAPGYDWPAKDVAFETHWRSLADTPRHLHALTLLTLSWGSHARTDFEQPDEHL